MPQLEIHHADGNVTYAELAREKPIMIGSGQNCDIVLADPTVKRVHCRLVWRDDRGEWRVEVAADAGGVQLGGRLVKAGNVRPGDVLGVGQCRIYMDSSRAEAKPSSMSSEITRALTGSGVGVQEAEPQEHYIGRGFIRKAIHMRDPRSFWQKTWEAVRRKTKEQLQGEVDRAPGEERIIGSPLVRWLLVGLVVVGALAWYFYTDFREKNIQAHFDKAQAEMGKENWEGAIHLFTSFAELYPTHELAGNARVQKALCDVQSAGSSVAAMEALRKMIRERSGEEGFQSLVPRISDVAGRLAQSMATQARDRADPKALERSQDALEIIQRDLPGANLSEEFRATLEKTMEEARRSIRKYEEFVSTGESMAQAIAAAQTRDAYHAYERLIQLYGDYADHPDLVERRNQATKLDRDAVKWEPMGKAAQTQPRATALAATTLLMQLNSHEMPTTKQGNVEFVLASGALSAHDGDTGKLLWSMVVGRDTNILPLAISPPGANDPVALVIDSRHDELVAVESKTGKLVWRQSLDEPIETAPLLSRGKLYQPGGKGSLFVIDSNTGRIDGRLRFGDQRLATTPSADTSGNRLYLLGEQYVLYMVTLGGVPKCESIYYTAHRPDSIIAAPLRMFRYLVFCENSTASTVRLRVFLLTPDGAVHEELQNIPRKDEPPLSGWVHHQPAVFGNLMFVATDLETVHVYSGGDPNKAEGFTPVPVKTASGGTVPAGTRPQAYSIFYGEKNLLVAGSMVRHYVFAAEQQTLTPAAEKLPGAASQAIQRYPATGGRVETIYVARRVPDSSAIVFTALDAGKLDIRWEVQLGSGVLSLQPADTAKNNWIALTRSGHVFAVSTAALAAGGMLDTPIGRVEIEGELSEQADAVVLGDGSSIVTPSGTPNRLFVREATDSTLRPLDLLAPLQTPIVRYENGFLAACTDGRIYWMSPETGKPLAEPFQPPLAADKPPQWRGVALTSKNTIIAVDSQGNLFQIAPRSDPTQHLAERSGSKFSQPIRSGIAISGNILGCVDDLNVLHVWDAEAISPINEIQLSAPASFGPVAAGELLFVVAGDEELVCVNSQGQEAWRHPLDGEIVVGHPLVKGEAVHFVTSSGLVRALQVTDGSSIWSVDTEKPLSEGPIEIGDRLVVIGDDGLLNVVSAPSDADR